MSASANEILGLAMDKAKQLKTILLAQGVTKLVFIGSALALLAAAAYSYMKGNEDEHTDNEDNGQTKPKRNQDVSSMKEKESRDSSVRI